MKIKAAASIFILFAVTTRGWTQPSPPTKSDATPDISEIATTFTSYQQITKSAVFVNFQLAILCRGASKEEVDAARIKYGPHANTSIMIYMNKSAANAFGTNSAVFPVGAVIVKQKNILGQHDTDGKWIPGGGAGIGGMVKRAAGYDPDHGDWEYFYFEDPKKIETGHISSCVQCHNAAKDKDHVFGTWREAIH